MAAKTITLKALVEKEKNKIIYVESEGDFVDVLCSFLTMPLGTIIRLTPNHPPIIELGCIKNLYASVENLESRYFPNEACRTMLLYPQNAAAELFKYLKVQIDDTDPVRYFLCDDSSCTSRLLSRCKGTPCRCGRRMNRRSLFYEPSDAIVCEFVSEVAQFIISDDLEVQPTSSFNLVSLLAKHGIHDFSSLEERTFQIGADEVLNLLKFSLVSRTPLTDVLLQKSPTREVSVERMGQPCFVKLEATEDDLVQNDSKVSVKLLISKSKRIVCYAEVGVDFVDLLFSFLTVPLCYASNEAQGASVRGSLKNLYRSVHGLELEEVSLNPQAKNYILYNPEFASVLLDLEGFVRRPAMFRVTDDLNVTPTALSSGLSILMKLDVPYADIEVRTVLVGKEEAWSLLVAAFNCSSCALTDVFLPKPQAGSAKRKR